MARRPNSNNQRQIAWRKTDAGKVQRARLARRGRVKLQLLRGFLANRSLPRCAGCGFSHQSHTLFQVATDERSLVCLTCYGVALLKAAHAS